MKQTYAQHRIVPLKDVIRLAPWSSPIRDGRTRFRNRVLEPGMEPHVIKSSYNVTKLGRTIEVGRWKGLPLYHLAMEERRACPSTCRLYDCCYGNSLTKVRRWRHGPKLLRYIQADLDWLDQRRVCRNGYVLRLHLLGDFFSVAYVEFWLRMLTQHPLLRIYGYTAWQPHTPIGRLIAHERDRNWERFAIRTSESDLPEKSTKTISFAPDRARIGNARVCPADQGRGTTCGKCGLCWETQEPILFPLRR